jgi:hypothetical protein
MTVSRDILEFLQRTDTWIVSNAIEGLNVRMRNEGYVHARIGRALGCVGYLTNGTIRDGDLNGIRSVPDAVNGRLSAAVEKIEPAAGLSLRGFY